MIQHFVAKQHFLVETFSFDLTLAPGRVKIKVHHKGYRVTKSPQIILIKIGFVAFAWGGGGLVSL